MIKLVFNQDTEMALNDVIKEARLKINLKQEDAANGKMEKQSPKHLKQQNLVKYLEYLQMKFVMVKKAKNQNLRTS